MKADLIGLVIATVMICAALGWWKMGTSVRGFRFWMHEKVHALAVYCFGARTYFRFQCGCGASVLGPVPERLMGAAFPRGGTFDISRSNGTTMKLDCEVCGRAYELTWNATKEQFTVAGDFTDFLPAQAVFTVKDAEGKVVAERVSMMAARKYQEAWEGSTIEQG